jgi:hypothetical protein
VKGRLAFWKVNLANQDVPLRPFATEKPWTQMFGGLKHLKKETARIQQLIDNEFEKIEPEDCS